MRQHRRSGPLDARESALMYLLCKYVRQAGAAPLPEPSPPSDPATLWAGDLRRSATLARAVLADGQNPFLPCHMADDVGQGFDAPRSRKNPHKRDHRDRAIGAFSGGAAGPGPGSGEGVKLTFAFLANTTTKTQRECQNAILVDIAHILQLQHSFQDRRCATFAGIRPRRQSAGLGSHAQGACRGSGGGVG